MISNADHSPHVEPSVDSAYCTSYAEISFPTPPDAPLHDNVTASSASVALISHAVGALQAVNAQKTLLLISSLE